MVLSVEVGWSFEETAAALRELTKSLTSVGDSLEIASFSFAPGMGLGGAAEFVDGRWIYCFDFCGVYNRESTRLTAVWTALGGCRKLKRIRIRNAVYCRSDVRRIFAGKGLEAIRLDDWPSDFDIGTFAVISYAHRAFSDALSVLSGDISALELRSDGGDAWHGLLTGAVRRNFPLLTNLSLTASRGHWSLLDYGHVLRRFPSLQRIVFAGGAKLAHWESALDPEGLASINGYFAAIPNPRALEGMPIGSEDYRVLRLEVENPREGSLEECRDLFADAAREQEWIVTSDLESAEGGMRVVGILKGVGVLEFAEKSAE